MRSKAGRPRTILVQMPWCSTRLPLLSLAALKAYLRAHRYPCDVAYPSLLWARQIGVFTNDFLAHSTLLPEWVFSHALFGPAGTGEMHNTWANMLRSKRMGGSGLKGLLFDPAAWRMDWKVLAAREAPLFLKNCLDHYEWRKYDVIGFSTFFNMDLASLALARLLKQRYPDKLIVFGGNLVAGEMGLEHLRAFPWVDAVVDGEGERPLLDLVRAVESGGSREPITGVRRRDDGPVTGGAPHPRVRLDELPVPDFSDYYRALRDCRLAPMVDPILPFESARGCAWGQRAACSYCSIYDKPHRVKSGARLARELRGLAAAYGANHLSGACSHLDMRALPQLKNPGLDLRLRCFTRATLNKSQLRMMAGAGVYTIRCGVETLDSHSLRLMRKGTRGIDNIQMLKHAREYGMTLDWKLLHAVPGQTAEDYGRILRTACAISHLEPPGLLGRVEVYRFSPYHSSGERLGIRNMRPKSIYEFLYPSSRVDLARIAFRFDHDVADESTHLRYEAQLKSLSAVWQEVHRKRRSFLFFERLPRLLKVYDRRLTGPRDPKLVCKLHTLSGLRASLLLRCDSMRSEGELVRFAARRCGSRTSKGRVRKILAELVDSRLLFFEGAHYLSLVLPAAAYPREVRDSAGALAVLGNAEGNE